MSELSQADRDAQLLVEAFVLGQQNPAVWDAYVKGWESDVERRIRERWGNTTQGSSGTAGGTGTEPGPAAPDST